MALEARSRRIVHQYPVLHGGTPGKRRERPTHRETAVRAARDRRHGRRWRARRPAVLRERQPRSDPRPLAVVRRKRHDDPGAATVGEEGSQRPFDHGPPGELRVLLR